MTTPKYDFPTTGYSVQGWDAIITAAIEAIDTAIPSRELVTLGETVVAYEAAYFEPVDSKWYKAQANGILQPAHGLFLEGGDEDDEVRIHRMGKVTNAGWAWAGLGDPVYLDPDTAGSLTQTPPAADRQIIGYALSATSILVIGTPVLPASETASGIVELATAAEINTGTDAGRAISPDALAGSNFGRKTVQIMVVDAATDVTTGDGKTYFVVPDELTGMNLVRVAATVITAGIVNSTTIAIYNVTDAQEMLSALMAIETTETSTRTSAAPGEIDTTKDDVVTGDLLRIDVDAVSATAPKGLIVELVFQLP